MAEASLAPDVTSFNTATSNPCGSLQPSSCLHTPQNPTAINSGELLLVNHSCHTEDGHTSQRQRNNNMAMAKPYGRDLFSRLRANCRQRMWVAGTSSQESQPTQEALAALE